MIDADVSANPRAERWQQYLDDLHAYASVPLPLPPVEPLPSLP